MQSKHTISVALYLALTNCVYIVLVSLVLRNILVKLHNYKLHVLLNYRCYQVAIQMLQTFWNSKTFMQIVFYGKDRFSKALMATSTTRPRILKEIAIEIISPSDYVQDIQTLPGML